MPKCKRKRKFKWNNNKTRLNKHCQIPWICSCSWFHFLLFPYSGDSTYTMFTLEVISKGVVLKLRYSNTVFQDFTWVHCSSLGAREGVCSCLCWYKAAAAESEQFSSAGVWSSGLKAQLPKCLGCNWVRSKVYQNTFPSKGWPDRNSETSNSQQLLQKYHSVQELLLLDWWCLYKVEWTDISSRFWKLPQCHLFYLS